MTGYSKLFSSILTSSVWVEDHPVLRVWIALLALSDSAGIVEGAIPGLAHLCRMTIDETEIALGKLSGPDPYSRTPDHEGRRIAPVEGGWRILNYLKYREKGQQKDGSRAQYMREYRDAVTCNSEMLHVTPVTPELLRVTQRQRQRHKQTTTNLETPTELEHHGLVADATALPAVRSPRELVFDHWRAVMGKPRAKLDAKRSAAIDARLRDGYSPEDLCRAVDGCKRSAWHQGANDRGKAFNDLTLICRDAQHVDEFTEIEAKATPRETARIAPSEAERFWSEHGAPPDAAAKCADAIRGRAYREQAQGAPENHRQAIDAWLDQHHAPHAVRVDLIRRVLQILKGGGREGTST